MELRCLIVDDSRTFVDAARTALGRQGVRIVAAAASCDEAVACAREHRPDVTLVDVDLGEADGFRIARELAGRGGSAGTLILVSAHDERDYADLIESSPAAGFIPKGRLSRAAIDRLVGREDR